jgi:hypothetical protein
MMVAFWQLPEVAKQRNTMHVYEFGLASKSRTIAFLAAPTPGEENWPLSKLYWVDALENSASPGSAQPHVVLDPQTIPGPQHGIQMAFPGSPRTALECRLFAG